MVSSFFCEDLGFLEKHIGLFFFARLEKKEIENGEQKVSIEVRNKIYVNWYGFFSITLEYFGIRLSSGFKKGRCPFKV